MAKNVDEQIAEKQAEIDKLKEEQDKLKLENAPQYPKHVRVDVKDGDINSLKDADGKSYQVVEVQSEDHEKKTVAAAKAGKLQASAPVESADQKLKIDERRAKEESDKKYYGKETPENKASRTKATTRHK